MSPRLNALRNLRPARFRAAVRRARVLAGMSHRHSDVLAAEQIARNKQHDDHAASVRDAWNKVMKGTDADAAAEDNHSWTAAVVVLIAMLRDRNPFALAL